MSFFSYFGDSFLEGAARRAIFSVAPIRVKVMPLRSISPERRDYRYLAELTRSRHEFRPSEAGLYSLRFKRLA